MIAIELLKNKVKNQFNRKNLFYRIKNDEYIIRS